LPEHRDGQRDLVCLLMSTCTLQLRSDKRGGGILYVSLLKLKTILF
jgi:hypothetical protein